MAKPMEIVGAGRLAEIYGDLLVLGAYIRDAKELGAIEQLRARIHRLFQTAEEQTRSAGIPQDTLTQCQYAVAAYLDEMVINSRWSLREQWASKPLQYDFFGEFVAGEGFFKRLDVVRNTLPVNVELLEVFSLCLIFGFEGQYRLHDREMLKGVLQDVTREIQAKRGEAALLSPRGRRPDELMEMVKRELPAWAILVTSAGLVLLFYLALSFLSSQDAGHVVEQLRRLMQETRS
ncbi:MAG: type IVB secretion system protein IcmH/DotU [Nitrospiraceae bacterium]